MRATSTAQYALRLTLNQLPEYVPTSSGAKSADKFITRSAAAMAAFGIGLSTFSLKQMVNSSPKTAARKF